MGTSSVAQAPERRCPSARPGPWTGPSRSGMQRLDPEVLGAHLGRLLRTASALCDSRESAEDLVQETVGRVLARPRWLRGGDELAYLTQALRNTFVTSTRTAARRPRAVTPLEEFDPADRRTGARPEEALIIGQVFPAIARLPESFRLALVRRDTGACGPVERLDARPKGPERAPPYSWFVISLVARSRPPRCDQAGDGRLGAAGQWEDLALARWARRSTSLRRVAFVSVDRDQEDAQRFWSTVLDAIRRPTSSVGPETQPAATAGFDADQLARHGRLGAGRRG